MDGILRFPGGTRRSAAIARWFDERPPELGAIARPWFELMRECGPDVVELLHDHHPTACIGDVAFGYVNVFRHHVNVGFFNGVGLPDPAGLLEGAGKRMRHVKLRPDRLPDPGALSALIRAAYLDGRARAAR
jgi:hypothetical protein